MSRVEILYPLLAMVALVLGASLRLLFVNIRGAMTGQVQIRYFKFFDGEAAPDEMRKARDLYKNLWELPVLFYTLVLVLYTTGRVEPLDVGLAWAFVASRWVHAGIRISDNHVLRRFTVFSVGFALLLAGWISFAVRLLG